MRRYLKRGPEDDARRMPRGELVKNPYHTVNQGNVVDVLSVGSGFATDITGPTVWQSGIDIDLQRVAPETALSYSAGSWVAVVTTEIIDAAEAPAPNPFLPLRAKVEFGTGGVGHVFECDGAQAIIPLPSAQCRVSFGWAQLIPEVAANIVERLPLRTRVKVTLQRSYTDSDLLTHTTPLTDDSSEAAPATGGNWRVRIPPFAKSWRIIAPEPEEITWGFQVTQASQSFPALGVSVDIDTDSARIARWVRNRCWRPVDPPAVGGLVSLSVLPGVGQQRVWLTFKLEM